MANYELMIHYINMVDNDIKILQEKPGSKPLITRLIKLQEYTKAEWASIHSIVKSMNGASDQEAFKKTQQIIDKGFKFNLKINKFYDDIATMCEIKSKKGNSILLNFLLQNLFFNYTILLDAIHFMNLYYVPAESFPFILSDMYLQKKFEMMRKRKEELEGKDELDS